MQGTTRSLVAASVAGVLAALGVAALARAADEPGSSGDPVHCYGVNKCKGTGDCGGKGHTCAGTNACKGQAFIDMDKDDCVRLEGGRLTEAPEPAAPEAGS